MANRAPGRIHRAIRIHLGLRQLDVAETAGVSRQKVSRLERNQLDELRWGDIRACFAALGGQGQVTVRWQGAALDRLLDEGHARLVGYVVDLLRRLGWQIKFEVSYSVYGDRGSIDILALHQLTSTLLVVEIKTELASIEGLLRPLDVKARLAAQIARRRFGWQVARVARLVVLPEDSSARRRVARHAAVLDAALPTRGHEVRRWLAAPRGSLAGLWFLSADRPVSTTRNPSAVRRVRRRKSADS
jgi:transcriptional regulator with XRE-family HTH domain